MNNAQTALTFYREPDFGDMMADYRGYKIRRVMKFTSGKADYEFWKEEGEQVSALRYVNESEVLVYIDELIEETIN